LNSSFITTFVVWAFFSLSASGANMANKNKKFDGETHTIRRKTYIIQESKLITELPPVCM
jgi:hypothetical protein